MSRVESASRFRPKFLPKKAVRSATTGPAGPAPANAPPIEQASRTGGTVAPSAEQGGSAPTSLPPTTSDRPGPAIPGDDAQPLGRSDAPNERIESLVPSDRGPIDPLAIQPGSRTIRATLNDLAAAAALAQSQSHDATPYSKGSSSRSGTRALGIASDDSGNDTAERRRQAPKKARDAERLKTLALIRAQNASEDRSDEADGRHPMIAPVSTAQTNGPLLQTIVPNFMRQSDPRKPQRGRPRKWSVQSGQALSTIPRRGRPRREATPEDAESQILDPTKTTMMDLCGDIKIGRPSKRAIELKEEANKRVKEIKTLKEARTEARLRQKELIAENEQRRQMGLPPRAPQTPPSESTPPPDHPVAATDGPREGIAEGEERAEQLDAEDAEEDIENTFAESNLVPQLAFSADGKMIVDAESLQRTRPQRQQSIDSVIIEEPQGGMRVTSATWGKRKATVRWTAKDLDDLWEFLSMSGLDYQRIALWFGTYEDSRRGCRIQRRTRQQVKKKLDKLAKLDPLRFDSVVYGAGRKSFDHERYRHITGDDATMHVEDPMAPHYKDLPGHERPSDAVIDAQQQEERDPIKMSEQPDSHAAADAREAALVQADAL